MATVLHGQDEVLSQIQIIDGGFDADASLQSGTYTAIIYEEIKDEFGFETIYDEIGRHNIKALNPSDLAGVTFFIGQVDTVDEIPKDLPILHQKCQITLEKWNEENKGYTGYLKDYTQNPPVNFPVLVLYPNPMAT